MCALNTKRYEISENTEMIITKRTCTVYVIDKDCMCKRNKKKRSDFQLHLTRDYNTANCLLTDEWWWLLDRPLYTLFFSRLPTCLNLARLSGFSIHGFTQHQWLKLPMPTSTYKTLLSRKKKSHSLHFGAIWRWPTICEGSFKVKFSQRRWARHESQPNRKFFFSNTILRGW